MRKTFIAILFVASVIFAGPIHAETDIGKALSAIAQSLMDQETDRNASIEAQRLNTAAAYSKYLTLFPKGAFRANANQALAKLGAAAAVDTPPVSGRLQTAATREGSIGLSRNQRILIQKQLTLIGYPTGVVDGL